MKISSETQKTIEQQFALDCNLEKAEEIVKGKVFLSKTKILPGARIVDKTDQFLRVIIFMDKAYIMADDSIYDGLKELYSHEDAPEWFFKFPNLRILDHILGDYNREIADTHIYFLPDEDARIVKSDREEKWFTREEIEAFREQNPFQNALAFSPTQPDVIAVAAIEKEKMKGMAGASLDGEYVRQIGIDVLEEYRGEGLATYLTTILKQRIMEQGKLPFYGTSESHGISRSVAIKSGFLPAWAEIYVKTKTTE